MADSDEDVIPSTAATGADDLEDETQDFRFLAQLTALSASGASPVVPKRGTKDFEPNPTRSQASALDASRLAMHTALSAPRIHSGRNHIVGQYLADESLWRWEDGDSEGGGARNGRCVVVYKFKSSHFKVMGQGARNNWVWFLPEEALYLLDRGSLDIRWPDVEVENSQQAPVKDRDSREGERPFEGQDQDLETAQQEDEHDEDADNVDRLDAEADPALGEIPMSLQGAYASFIGKDGLTLERYSVYSGLKRSGYIVQRAPTWHDALPQNGSGHATLHNPAATSTLTISSPVSPNPEAQRQSVSGAVNVIRRLCSWLFAPRRGEACPPLGPLVAPGLYRDYIDIFRALSLIPYHDPNSKSHTTADTCASASSLGSAPPPNQPHGSPPPPFRVHFHAWKPTTAYRKTAPPPPDYRIVVVDARTTPMPTLSQISDLLDSLPADSLSKEKVGKLESRIKHGKRNVILAVVDMGIVSYLRLSDACFGAEKLFEDKARRGPKGKGKWKGKAAGAGAQGKKVQGQK